MQSRFFMCLLAFSGFIFGWAVTNGENAVIGEPTVDCNSETVAINFRTKRPFDGRVFAKGFVEQKSCVEPGIGDQSASLNLTFSECGVQRFRQVSPPGITITFTIIISFHKTFITRLDKAYRVSCFYMEAVKTVSSELDVSMMSTGFITSHMVMPFCKYEILSGSATGPLVKYVKVGDLVYHRWSCESHETIFCMRVHSCNVDDGQGGLPFQVLDAKGCSVDNFVLQNLDYLADLIAGREAYVFKFADKPTLFFNCQVEIVVKTAENPYCNATRPRCTLQNSTETVDISLNSTSEDAGSRSARNRRESDKTANHKLKDFTSLGDFDLPRQELLVFDLQDSNLHDIESDALNFSDTTNQIFSNDRRAYYGEKSDKTFLNGRLCLSLSLFYLSILTFFCIFLISFAFCINAVMIRRKFSRS